MKALLILAFSFSTAFASDATFNCKESAARYITKLTVNAQAVEMGSEFLVRDMSYVPGNNGKRYYRFSNETMDLLVPTLMVRNRINRGVVVAYTEQGKVRFFCVN